MFDNKKDKKLNNFFLNEDDIVKELLKNNRISQRVHELNLTKTQIYEAIPILIDMNEEKDDENTNLLTSFFVSKDKNIKRIYIDSSFGKKNKYLQNIVTKNINPINFEEEKKFFYEEERKYLIDKFSKIIQKKNKNKQKLGIYIYGKPGIGKTFICKRFAKKLAEKNYKVGFINLPNFINELKKLFSLNLPTNDLIDKLKKVDYLFLDDIGAEVIVSWFREGFLFDILNERMNHNKVTCFSSNYSMERLKNIQAQTQGQKYSDYEKAMRLLERIKSVAEEILLEGKNKRY